MSNCLVVLDKYPSVQPLRIGEVCRRLFAKCVLGVLGQEAKEACGNAQLCAGPEAVIEGGDHAACSPWNDNINDEEWGFLLVNARNALN